MNRREFIKILSASVLVPVIGLPVAKAAPVLYQAKTVVPCEQIGMGLYELLAIRRREAMLALARQLEERAWATNGLVGFWPFAAHALPSYESGVTYNWKCKP